MCWELAGAAGGVDANKFSLRELVWLANGRRREEWDHSILHAAAMGGKVDLDRMNPYRRPVEKSLTPEQRRKARKAAMADYVASMKAMNTKRKKQEPI